jgi:FlaA1/EpsC-like NDP-sugar epimerase
MVTGGAGSIGSELARQIAASGPARLVLVEQAESPLYFIDLELRRLHPELEIVPVVADVTDQARIGASSRSTGRPRLPRGGLQARAADGENVVEAVRNNVFGTLPSRSAPREFGARVRADLHRQGGPTPPA